MARGPMVKSVDKARDFKGTIKKLINYIKEYRIALTLVMIFAALSTIFSIMGPKILGNTTGLKPFWIIFAITVGGAFAGPLGMFLGVPVVAVISFLLQKIVNEKLKKKNITVDK